MRKYYFYAVIFVMLGSIIFTGCGDKEDTLAQDSETQDTEDYYEEDAWAYYEEGYDYEADQEFDELFDQMRESSRICAYDRKTGRLTCNEEDGCGSKRLAVANNIVIGSHLTKKGIKNLKKNKHIQSLRVKDLSNLTEDDKMEIYLPLARGDIAMAALLFAHEDYASSVGNDGTRIYKRVMKKKCPSVTVNRSCASVVSGAICAAGAADYASAATAGLITYFESNQHWKNMGKLPESKLKSGDIIFIDRKSHIKEYQSGKMDDSEQEADKEENAVSASTVHDHVLVWVGNEKVRRVFPNSDGNSVSGSYSEVYKTARSAAVGKYNMTGDYRIYRYKP